MTHAEVLQWSWKRAYWCIMRKGDVFKEHMLTKTMSFHN